MRLLTRMFLPDLVKTGCIVVAMLSLTVASSVVRGQSQDEDMLDLMPGILAGASAPVKIVNGWFTSRGKAIWGNCQHNGWWRSNRASIVRRSNSIGPNLQEDIPLLVANMKEHGYPCFEHTPPLWHDRRRDVHDSGCRRNGNIVGPTLQFPWARSQQGTACDGGRRYDLTRFDSWYFDRIEEMARESQREGTVFIVNLYLQHPLLERTTHYVDFPWRPGNSIQSTGMPSRIPAANSFYSNRRDLHSLYIRKLLDTLKPFKGTVISLGAEYTGSLSFMRFYLDEIQSWKNSNSSQIYVSVGATKDVLDGILRDSRRRDLVDVIDLRYFWYERSGRLFAPRGGRQVAGRYALGTDIKATSPAQIYRQVRAYRDAWPDKAIVHHIEANRDQTIAFLMAGGSTLIKKLQYRSSRPRSYEAPPDSFIIAPVYRFIEQSFGRDLATMRPASIVTRSDSQAWAMRSVSGPRVYLIYSKPGRVTAILQSGTYEVQRFDSNTGRLINRFTSSGGVREFNSSGGRSSFFVIKRQ